MIDPMFALTILLMAIVTYLTRIGGYLFLRSRTVNERRRSWNAHLVAF